MKTIIMLLGIVCAQLGFSQGSPGTTGTKGTKFQISQTEIRKNPIDSTIVSIVTIPNGSGDSGEVFSDDTGCLRGNAVADSEMNATLRLLASEKNEEARLQAAFKFARKSCLNSAQIVALCKTFGLETTRLEFAKFAYSACVDQKNYKFVYAVFEKPASKTDLTMYITGK